MARATTGTKKERTHERIVQSAARALRRDGFDGVGVAEVMQDAGLTHGGFYAHFPSREALLVEALDSAAAESAALFDEAASPGDKAEGLKLVLERYLSDEHAQAKETGCTLAALGTETRRQSPELRAVATRRLQKSLAALEGLVPGNAAERRERAQAVMATLVGSLVLSRVVTDAELGKSLRRSAKRFLRGALT
jgi:TetR/AcrR family transcriptional regulator, transcriptional repressor for nem operon